MNEYTEDDYLEHFELYLECDGDLELDRNPDRKDERVSVSADGGAYVLCWKWIDDDDLNRCLN